MYKIKNLKTKKQITFEIPFTKVDSISLLYCFDNFFINSIPSSVISFVVIAISSSTLFKFFF